MRRPNSKWGEGAKENTLLFQNDNRERRQFIYNHVSDHERCKRSDEHLVVAMDRVLLHPDFGRLSLPDKEPWETGEAGIVQ